MSSLLNIELDNFGDSISSISGLVEDFDSIANTAILGEISWKRSTYRLKFEHGQFGKCLRNSLIRQCHM
jgi:hypothetical protein